MATITSPEIGPLPLVFTVRVNEVAMLSLLPFVRKNLPTCGLSPKCPWICFSMKPIAPGMVVCPETGPYTISASALVVNEPEAVVGRLRRSGCQKKHCHEAEASDSSHAEVFRRNFIHCRPRLLNFTRVCGKNIVHLLGPTLDLLDRAAIFVGGLRVSLLTVVKGVLSLTVLLWAATVGSTLFERRMTRVPEITPRARALLGKLLKTTLVTLAVVTSLASIGVDLSTFALFTGALGVGVGLGLQRTVSNLFSGIVLLLDKSIKPGDVIDVGGTYGWVSSLGARYVAVETRDGTEFLIPNEDIITHQVVNWSHNDDRVRLKIPLHVPHDSDLDQAMTLMLEAAALPPRVLASPSPNVLIMAFGESAIELELRFWIADAQNGVHNVKSQILYGIWQLFQREGIRIPYPKRDLYLRSSSARSGIDRP